MGIAELIILSTDGNDTHKSSIFAFLWVTGKILQKSDVNQNSLLFFKELDLLAKRAEAEGHSGVKFRVGFYHYFFGFDEHFVAGFFYFGNHAVHVIGRKGDMPYGAQFPYALAVGEQFEHPVAEAEHYAFGPLPYDSKAEKTDIEVLGFFELFLAPALHRNVM